MFISMCNEKAVSLRHSRTNQYSPFPLQYSLGYFVFHFAKTISFFFFFLHSNTVVIAVVRLDIQTSLICDQIPQCKFLAIAETSRQLLLGTVFCLVLTLPVPK